MCPSRWKHEIVGEVCALVYAGGSHAALQVPARHHEVRNCSLDQREYHSKQSK